MISFIERLQNYRTRLHRYRYQHAIDMAHKYSVDKNPDDYKTIRKIIDAYRSGGGLSHNFQEYKLFQLRKLLQRIKPRMILELGSGSSTAIFAEYVRLSQDPCFVCSIDDNESWLTQAKEIAWDGRNLDGLSEFIYAPRVVNENLIPPESRYDIVLEPKYDFVFIDGPPMRAGNKKNKLMINSNIFDLINGYAPKTVIVDIRRPTVEEIQRRYSEIYEIQLSDVILGEANKRDYNYFTKFTKLV